MANRFLILIFSLLLISPVIINLSGLDKNKLFENRVLTKKPELPVFLGGQKIGKKSKGVYSQIINYKDQYDEYYTDNFPLKGFLYKPYYFIQSDLLKVNPLPSKVVEGKNGWFFLGDDYSNAIKESIGIGLFHERKLEEIRQNLISNFISFKNNGIKYYLAIAPNKLSIYPENLFGEIDINITKAKQVERIANELGIGMTFLGKGFDEISHQLYFKTNTHWNDLGAYYGYLNLMELIKEDYPNIRIVPKDQLKIKSRTSTQEDLTLMLNIHVPEKIEEYSVRNKKSKKIASVLKVPKRYPREANSYELRYKSNVNELKLVMFRDSFSEAMIKYISESFGECVFIWDNRLDNDLIQIEKPDIVIHQIVERNIDFLLKENRHSQNNGH